MRAGLWVSLISGDSHFECPRREYPQVGQCLFLAELNVLSEGLERNLTVKMHSVLSRKIRKASPQRPDCCNFTAMISYNDFLSA